MRWSTNKNETEIIAILTGIAEGPQGNNLKDWYIYL